MKFAPSILLSFLVVPIFGIIRIPGSTSCPKEANGNCEPGWKNFTRPSGEWCMKVFYERLTSYEAARKKCEEHGGKLSGYQNQHEMLYVTYTVVDHLFPESGVVWVGIHRTEECLKEAKSAKCNGDTAFEWTDGSANGTEGFHWVVNQPDNGGYNKKNQACATLVASPERHMNGYQTGMMDDVMCEVDMTRNDLALRIPKAYVCGKKPTV